MVSGLESVVAARISRLKLLQASSVFFKVLEAADTPWISGNWNQAVENKPHKWCILQNKSLNLLDILKSAASRMESGVTRIEPPELESAATYSQSQDKTSLKSYPVAETQVTRRMEPAVTRIHPPELESAATHSQPQDGVSFKSYPIAGIRVSGRMESAVTRIQPPKLQSAIGRTRVGRNSYPAAGFRVNRRMESAVTRIQPTELESAVTCIQSPELETAAARI